MQKAKFEEINHIMKKNIDKETVTYTSNVGLLMMIEPFQSVKQVKT